MGNQTLKKIEVLACIAERQKEIDFTGILPIQVTM